MFTIGKSEAGGRSAICSAIKSRRVIEFYYHGGYRLAEPFCLGMIMAGEADNESLLCYQVGGYSEFGDAVGWKLFRASEIEDPGITGEHFSGERSGYDPDNLKMTAIYCRVPAGTESKIGPEEAKVSIRQTKVRAQEAVAPMPKIEREILRYDMPRKQTTVFFTHNELMRRFRMSHPIPAPGRYTSSSAGLLVTPYQNA